MQSVILTSLTLLAQQLCGPDFHVAFVTVPFGQPSRVALPRHRDPRSLSRRGRAHGMAS